MTHFIIFHNRQKKIDIVPKIIIDKNNIDQVRSTKCLGVHINENLTWSDHISAVLNKTSKNLGIIRKLSKRLSSDILLTLYNALIAPYLDYCNFAWSSRDTTEFKKLCRVQKKALSLITGRSWQTHLTPLFKIKRILRLHDINTVQVACFVYGVVHNTLPALFRNCLVTNKFIPHHFTRHNENIHILRCNTNVREFCIKIYGAKIWNSVPLNIKSATSINNFKQTFRSHLFDLYN